MIEAQLLNPVVERLRTWVAPSWAPPPDNPSATPVPYFRDWKVDHFPDDVERYNFKPSRHELLVAYERSDWEAPQSHDPVSQRRQIEFSVTVLARSMRGARGVVDTLDRVRQALVGWRAPTGGGPIYAYREEFVNEDNGVWRYVVLFRLNITDVGAHHTTRTGPALTGAGVTHRGCAA
jgi:hypothetical protein